MESSDAGEQSNSRNLETGSRGSEQSVGSDQERPVVSGNSGNVTSAARTEGPTQDTEGSPNCIQNGLDDMEIDRGDGYSA